MNQTLLIHSDGSTGIYLGPQYITISHESGTYCLHQWNAGKDTRIPYYRALAYEGSAVEARQIVKRYYSNVARRLVDLKDAGLTTHEAIRATFDCDPFPHVWKLVGITNVTTESEAINE